MNILEDLWYGQICPVAGEDYQNQEYRKLIELLDRHKKQMLPTLNQKQQEDLLKLEDLWEDMEQITQCTAFITGFRLAIQLMAASM